MASPGWASQIAPERLQTNTTNEQYYNAKTRLRPLIPKRLELEHLYLATLK